MCKEKDSWKLLDDWKAHHSTITKLSWAPPEYGQILASASHDGTVKINEEDPRQMGNSGKSWKNVATLRDFQGALFDIEFAPGHLGLKLACISNDGIFRLYEPEAPNSLRSWNCTSEMGILKKPAANGLQSSFALSWCPSMFFKEFIVISALDSAQIYYRKDSSNYVPVAQLGDHKGLIRDVAWAPSMGRSYQLIATACKDGFLRIFKVTASQDQGIPLVTVHQVSQFNDHGGEVWRISWNLTGTILASTGDDAKVRFYKSAYSSQFQCVAQVSAEKRQSLDDQDMDTT